MILTRNLFLFLIGLFLFSSPPIASASEGANLKGAVCVIRSGDKVVMVNEILTKKLSLPAGTILPGEDPALAAQRETWEETGLVVSIAGELGRTDEAIFYNCVSDSDIVAFQFNNHLDGNELPVWFAPHYGIEVASATLIDPTLVPAHKYRFPEQLKWLVDILPNATDQSVIYVGNLVEAAPKINQIELDWIVHAQSAIHRMSAETRFVIEYIFYAGGVLASPILLLVVIPLIYWKFGKQFAYKVFFAVTVTSLLALVAQQGFNHPRPHVYIPAVEVAHSYGYSLPSLSMSIWFCVGIWVLHASKRLSVNRWSVALLCIVIWLSLSRFYNGAAFLLDSVSGAVLGALCAWHMIRLDVKPDVNLIHTLSSKAVWITLAVLTAVLTFFWPIPAFTYWLAITITICALVATLKDDNSRASGLTIATAALLAIALDLVWDNLIAPLSHSGLYSLIAETLRYPLVILLFVLIIRINTKFQR